MRTRRVETRLVWEVREVPGLAERAQLSAPARVHALLCGLGVPEQPTETFWLICLDAKHRYLGHKQISQGTVSTSLVHPREVFAPAIECRASAIVIAHNHPSGDCEPSPEDLAVTRRLREAGLLLGIPLLDHLICGSDGDYISLRERCGL